MRFEQRRIIYLIFGLLPGLIPLALALLGLFFGFGTALQSISIGEYKNLIASGPLAAFCAITIASYICGYMVIFKKDQIIKTGLVISGLIFGAIVCGAYSFVFSKMPIFQLLFIFPAIIGVCLAFELISPMVCKKCT